MKSNCFLLYHIEAGLSIDLIYSSMLTKILFAAGDILKAEPGERRS
jgi:hypothetical protein